MVDILFFEKIPIDYLRDLYITENGIIRDFSNGKLYPCFKSNYDRVVLPLKNGKRQFFSIHRLIALTFVKNDDPQKTQVNHKDGNKFNNNAYNLEWVSPKENVRHSIEHKLSKGRSVKVRCIDPKTKKVIGEFENIILASKMTKSNDRHISDVCKGKRKTCGGYIWEYVNENYSNIENSVPDGMIFKNYDNYIFTDTGLCYSIRSKKYMNIKYTQSGGSVSLCFNGEKKDYLIHQIIAMLYLRKNSRKKRVKHLDGNKKNNRVSNLQWY